jgi:hypothetical protein
MPELERWQQVWRDGLAPILSDRALQALQEGLERLEPTLLQGATTLPQPIAASRDWKCEGGCAIAYCGWRGEGLMTVGEVEEFFANCCAQADLRLGYVGACVDFINFFDEGNINEVRVLLGTEVKLEQQRRLDKRQQHQDF